MKTIIQKSIYTAAALLLTGAVFAQNSGIVNDKNTKTNKTTTKLDRSKRPVAGPAPEVKLGKAEKFVMPNGLTVFVVENHKIPKVSINMSLDIDPFKEGDKVGYVDMAGQLIGTATKTMTKDQINEKVDFIGAEISPSSGGLYGSCLKKHLDTYMQIYSDVLLNSVFKQDELDKIKKQTKSGLATQKSSPDAMMGNLSKAVIYGKDHAYGEVQTEANVDNITLEDCKGYYDQYFKPNVGYVTIVGDITVAEAKAMMDKYLAGWNKGEVKKHEVPPVASPKATKVSLANKGGAAQSTIRITYPLDFKPGNPDELKVAVMSKILGGDATARLFRNLRETYNFTYGAYSRVSTDENIGNFMAFADVRTMATDSAVGEFFKEMNKIIDEKVSVEELESAKKNMAGEFSIALERPSTIAKFANNIEKYKLPEDYYQTYLKRLSEVTVEDVQAMAKKYVRPEQAYILVVGDKEKVLNGLKKFSADGKVDLYDYLGDPEVLTKPIPAGITAQTILDNYIKAIGGKENLIAIKDEKISMEGSVQGQKLNFVTYHKAATKKAPYKFKEEMLFNGAMVVQSTTYDGKRLVETSMQTGSKEYTGAELTEKVDENQMYPEMRYKELGFTANAVGIDNLNGKDVYKLEVLDKKGNKSLKYFDVATGLKVRSEETKTSPQGSVTIITDFGDYKEVGKVKYPHSINIDFGQAAIAGKVTKVEQNAKMDDAVFTIK
ncbi:MAG TPA: pitrilysin family protein [Flavobacteriales bacterium]|nr:pitrilysin family protein [Flavobacteriales bacterium]